MSDEITTSVRFTENWNHYNTLVLDKLKDQLRRIDDHLPSRNPMDWKQTLAVGAAVSAVILSLGVAGGILLWALKPSPALLNAERAPSSTSSHSQPNLASVSTPPGRDMAPQRGPQIGSGQNLQALPSVSATPQEFGVTNPRSAPADHRTMPSDPVGPPNPGLSSPTTGSGSSTRQPPTRGGSQVTSSSSQSAPIIPVADGPPGSFAVVPHPGRLLPLNPRIITNYFIAHQIDLGDIIVESGWKYSTSERSNEPPDLSWCNAVIPVEDKLAWPTIPIGHSTDGIFDYSIAMQPLSQEQYIRAQSACVWHQDRRPSWPYRIMGDPT